VVVGPEFVLRVPPIDALFADAAMVESSPLLLILGLLFIPILVAINGFFVASEFALVALRRTRVQEMVNANVPRAKSLLEAMDNLDRSVAAAQLGITIASLALGLISEPVLHILISPLIDPLFVNLPVNWQVPLSRSFSFALALALMTYMHVVFGEQMPKMAALQSSERIGLFVGAPTNFFARMALPIIRLLNGSSALFLRRLGFRAVGHDQEVHTVDELRLLIEDTEEAGLLDPEAADYVLNVFELSSKRVRDVMVPWNKVMALELTTPPEKVLEKVREGAHTRMPVYHQEPNDIVGIVNSKDLFFLFSLKGLVNLEDARYDALFIDPDLPVSQAMRLFRKSRQPMAIVRQADRQVVGILTLEDVLEEIIGDIEDEHDDPARRRALVAKLSRRSGTTPRLPPNRPATGGL
jgi:putative hemolysin